MKGQRRQDGELVGCVDALDVVTRVRLSIAGRLGFTQRGGEIEIDVTQNEGTVRVSIGAPPTLVEARTPTPAPEVHAEPRHTGPGKTIGHIDELFRHLKEIEGSDLHLSSKEQPMVRVHGVMRKLHDYEVNDPQHLKKLLWQITPQRNCLDRETALRMWTENVTWFSNEEGKKGRIEVGQFADLVVPDRDFFACPESEIADTTALLTLVGGKVVYAAGAFASHDAGAPPP